MFDSPLVIASHNAGKVREFRELLAPLKVTVISAAELALPEPEETGSSFAENAMLKSQSAALLSGNFALADDSGLCIPALDDAPGIYSARWAGAAKDFMAAMERVRNELGAKGLEPNGQKAYFICVLALSAPDGKTLTFEGRVDGTLLFPPRGIQGFGYDSIFVPQGHSETFGEMEDARKHAISHRARAFEKCIGYMQKHTTESSV